MSALTRPNSRKEESCCVISPICPFISATLVLRAATCSTIVAPRRGGSLLCVVREWYAGRCDTGQIALRFPGDMCPEGCATKVTRTA